MNMQTLIDFRKRMENDEIESNLEGVDEVDQYLAEAGEYINQKSLEGQSIILNRMEEETFVRLVSEAQALISSSMASEGKGTFIMMAKMTGELDPYTHTVILAVLAILAEEEVI